jgi:hypothetical protein
LLSAGLSVLLTGYRTQSLGSDTALKIIINVIAFIWNLNVFHCFQWKINCRLSTTQNFVI